MRTLKSLKSGFCTRMISATIAMKACSTFVSFLALVSMKQISRSSAKSCNGIMRNSHPHIFFATTKRHTSAVTFTHVSCVFMLSFENIFGNLGAFILPKRKSLCQCHLSLPGSQRLIHAGVQSTIYRISGNFRCKNIFVVAINHENFLTRNYFYTSEHSSQSFWRDAS